MPPNPLDQPGRVPLARPHTESEPRMSPFPSSVSEQIVAFLSAPGSDDVMVSVERLSRELYFVFEEHPWELSMSADGQYGSLACAGSAINFTDFDGRKRLCELRRILNDPRMVALLDKPAHA